MKILFFLAIFASVPLFSQLSIPRELPQSTREVTTVNGINSERFVTPNHIFNNDNYKPVTPVTQLNPLSGSALRWAVFDVYAIGNNCAASANSLRTVVGWQLNQPERVSYYDNASNTPVWEHVTAIANNYNNYVAVSDNADYVASGSCHEFLWFNGSSPTPFFTYNLETQLPDTGFAGPVALTRDGTFMVATTQRADSSWVFGFSKDSAKYVWRFKVVQGNNSSVQGIKMAAYDSLLIVNAYGAFYVLRTYTGQLLYTGTIQGTQTYQGISGNGNIIASIDYYGNLKVYQRNGAASYGLLWQHTEPPGTYYNWMTAVDISTDGTKIACGTLNFVTGNAYDGKIKLFTTSAGSTPVWTFNGTGEQVASVNFSRNGNILAAGTYGDQANSIPDVLVFKVSSNSNVPIFSASTVGSVFSCSISGDGSTVIASGKKVHARAFGYGGEAYNFFIDTNDSPLGIVSSNEVPESFGLEQNYPNPFNPVTMINYSITNSGPVKLSIFDALGREVFVLVDKVQNKGRYSVELNAEKFGSGVYFYRLSSGENTLTKKLVLIK